MNHVSLVGRLTRNPEFKTLPSGNSVATFTLAINRNFKNKDGEYETDFISISVFGKQAENVSGYVFKGSLIGVEGRIQTRSYDAQDGSKRYVTEVIADHVEYMERKKEENNPLENKGEGQIEEENTTVDPFESFGQEVSLDESELPF